MCGKCKGAYLFDCEACDKMVKQGGVHCAGEDIADCSNWFCDQCNQKGITYCRYCFETDKVLDKLIEDAKKEQERLLTLLEIHLKYYKNL